MAGSAIRHREFNWNKDERPAPKPLVSEADGDKPDRPAKKRKQTPNA